MNRTLLATIAGTAALTSTAVARPEQNAFINRPANTIPELIAQMRSDPVVMDRFMRHFSMTRSQVLTYVGSLRLGTIPRSAYYNVYSVPEDGRIKVHKSYFKKGTPAFVNAQGQPILRIKCGNPFVPGPAIVSTATPGPVEPELAFQPIDATEPSAPDTPEISVVLPPPDVPEVLVAETPPPTIPTDAAVPGDPQFPVAPLAALAGLGAALSFGGSGRDAPPVPEPATLLALSVGGLALAARRRRRS